jgi:hypothetical protein
VKTFAGPLSKVTCSFELFVDAHPSGAYGVPFVAELTGGTTYSAQLFIASSNGAASVQLVGASTTSVPFAPLTPGAWHAIRVELPALRLFWNGVERPVDAGAPPAGPFGGITVQFGLTTNAGNQGGWRVALDDVACDVEP